MTLQQMRYFIGAAESGSISEAAKRSFTAQSSISGAIKEVENTYGITAFVRDSKGVRLTRSGEELLIEFKGILNRLDYLDEKFNGSKDRPLGLSVSSQHHICGINSFVSIIKSLNTGAGPYHCGFHECRTSEVMDRVERGLDDLGIVFVTEYSKGQMMQELHSKHQELVSGLVERIDPKGVGAKQKSIIDRCTGDLYEEAEQNGTVPTLAALREKLMEQPEAEAREIALALELFTTGSLDIFGHDSTVDLDKRVVVFDIHGLGEQLKPIGHLVITDTMLNRVTLNWKKGRRTHVFIDEFHVMFENEFSAAFFNSAWRQFRKRNAYPTAITQNVEYLLDSVQASTMLSNSEFIVMLNQAAGDREKLAHLLNISEEQMSYITNADAGCGLIKYGSALVPFVNRFPHNTELYRLMTTRPGEGRFSGGRA